MNIDTKHMIDIESNRTVGRKRGMPCIHCGKRAHGTINGEVLCHAHYMKAYMRDKRAKEKAECIADEWAD